MTLIFATASTHKLKEIKAILPDYEVLGLTDLGIYDDIPENGKTLEENAFIKAQYLYHLKGGMCLAEDTGLEVEALDRAPGVITARYAGEPRSDTRNIDKLLFELKDIQNRKAQFRTIIALIDKDGNKHSFEGIVTGTIGLQREGDGGFGYDPVFIPEGYDKSFAMLKDEIKNTISHRSRAVNKLVDFLNTTFS